MSLTKCTANTNVIENLPDAPTLPADELKRKFDEGSREIKKYLNNTLSTELDKLIANRVEKIAGKGLSTNDYSNDEKRKLAEIESKVFPIGSILMNTTNINPETYIGGTWELFGKGKTIVGVDPDDENFSEVEKTGGEKEHTLTVEEMPYHRHDIDTYGGDGPATARYTRGTENAVGLKTVSTHHSGENKPHNNLQPYITCYIWKRIA